MKQRTVYILAVLALFVAIGLMGLASKASAASALRILSEDNRETVWNLNADRMLSAANGTVLEAFGKVELRSGDDYLKADFARYYAKTNWVYLYGNIELKMGGDYLTAQEAEFDLRSRTGWLTDGRVFMAETNAYFAADRINKYRGNTYSFKDLKFTTCDGDVPAWSFEADTAIVEIEGYATLWNSKFQISDHSVMYSPYLIVPAKATRQTGFLIPDLGHSSKLGYFYTQPFYWAIDDSRDMTITEGYMSKHGFMHGLNYRSKASEDENLWMSFNYLYDRETVTSPNDAYAGDGLVRTNNSRYWLRGMYDWRFTGDPLWRLRADVDYVSDQYYLRDFKRDLAGYTHSRDALFSNFSRDLREWDTERQSGLMIFRDWERVGLYLSGTYTQDPELGNGNRARSMDTTVQHLPELNVYLQQGRVLDSIPLEFSGSGHSAYLYRREGTTGGRFDISPRATLPLSGRYGSIISSASLHSTWYRTESRESESSSEKSRYLPEYEASAATELAKVYSLQPAPLQEAGESRWVSLKHSVVPRLSYQHIPTENQTSNPQFTSYDRIAPKHELTYSIDNVLTRKREQKLARTDAKTKETEVYSQYDYQDVVRLRLEQAYSLYEARRGHDLDAYSREPWRDLMAELTFYWDETLSFTTRSYWTPSEEEITSHSHFINLNLAELGKYSTGLTYRKPVDDYYRKQDPTHTNITERLTTLTFDADFPVWGPLSASFYFNWDIKGQGKNEKGLALMYNHQCFSVGGQIIRDEDDTIFRVQFSLSGLGL